MKIGNPNAVTSFPIEQFFRAVMQDLLSLLLTLFVAPRLRPRYAGRSAEMTTSRSMQSRGLLGAARFVRVHLMIFENKMLWEVIVAYLSYTHVVLVVYLRPTDNMVDGLIKQPSVVDEV